MTLNELTGNRSGAVNINGGGFTDFLTGETVLDSASAEQNVNGDGKLKLAWKSLSGGAIAVGSTINIPDIGEYICMKLYAPVAGSDGVYSWSPEFVSTDCLFDKVYFTESVRFVGEQEDDVLYTFNYSGTLFTIVEALSQCAQANGLGAVVLGENISDIAIPTLSFDGDTIKSAAQKIAGAISKNITIIDGTLYIGKHEAYSTDEYYNRFIVLGGTRNMGKKTTNSSQFYTAVVQRLKLPASYAGSIISTGDNPPMYKLLIFDDVFPKMELYISSVQSYECWMMDENGERVVASRTVNTDPITGEETEVLTYKKYHQFYITLTLEDLTADGHSGNPEMYTLNASNIIAGKPLGILFQSGILQGREFDLQYYDPTEEPLGGYNLGTPADSVNGAAVRPTAGGYRIIMVADGDTLLPNSTLAPAVGDKVTLTGVALDAAYKERAQQELLARALPVISLYSQKKTPSFEASEMWPDFLLEGSGIMQSMELGGGYDIDPTTREVAKVDDRVSGEIDSDVRAQLLELYGDDTPEEVTPRRAPLRSGGLGTVGDYICTSITTNLLTGAKNATFGTFKPKGLLASMVDQLNKVTVNTSGGTIGAQDDYYRHTAAMGIDQFNALRQAGGALGMISVNQKIAQNAINIAGLSETVADVQQQTDKKFDIWFGNGIPFPQKSELSLNEVPEGHSASPAVDWNTPELKAKHVQDIYYDMTREAGADGGRAWRWASETVNGSTIYYWTDITDSDTEASLEKILDVASDGKLTGGSEKLRVLIDWYNAAEEYINNHDKNELYQLDEWTAYDLAFRELCQLLNNDAESFTTEQMASYLQTNIPVPYLLSNTDDMLYTTSEIDKQAYYDAWTNYYMRLAAFRSALIQHANDAADAVLQAMQTMASDDILTEKEKQSILREWHSVYTEYSEIVAQVRKAHYDTSAATYANYILAYRKLGTYLEAPWTTYNANNLLTLPCHEEPAMLVATGDSSINHETFNDLWTDYYDKRSALMVAINTQHHSTFVSTTVPDTPYYQGDLWIMVDNTGSVEGLMLCTNTRTTGNGNIEDWTEYSPNVDDVRILFANLIVEAWALIKDALTGDNRSIKLHFGGNPTASTGSLWFNSDAGKLYQGSGYTWGEAIDNPELEDTFRCIFLIIGEHTSTVYNSRQNEAEKYDIYVKKTSFIVDYDGQPHSYEGSEETLMYGDNGWEIINKSYNSLLENIGKVISMVVFGSEGANFATAAGAYITQNAIQMFAQAKVHDWKDNNDEWVNFPDLDHDANGDVLLTQALFGISVYQDEHGKWISVGRLKANLIDFEANDFKLSADRIQFLGKMLINNNLYVGEDGSISIRGTLESVNQQEKIFSQMEAGSFALGSLDDEGHKINAYSMRIVNGRPLLCFHDEYGNVIGQFGADFFSGMTIEPSWSAPLNLTPLLEGDTLSSVMGRVGHGAAVGEPVDKDYYQFDAGGQNTGGNRAPAENSSHGKWFDSTDVDENGEPEGTPIAAGLYVCPKPTTVEKPDGTKTGGIRVYQSLSDGELEETDLMLFADGTRSDDE